VPIVLPAPTRFSTRNGWPRNSASFAPSLRADGQLMAMESYSNNGMDVGVLAVDPRQWLPQGTLTPPADPAAPLAPLAAALPGPAFRPVGQAPLKAADDVKDVDAPDIGRKFRIRRGSLLPAIGACSS
jgi:hypothetical protein